MARNKASSKSSNRNITIMLIVGFIVAAGGIVISEVQSNYLRTSAVPTGKTIIPTDAPNSTTKIYKGETFQFTYPDNWEILSGVTEFRNSGNKLTIGDVTLYSFPFPLNPNEIEEFRTSILETKDVVTWTGKIGSHPQATFWAKASHLGSTSAPIGQRFVLLEDTNNTIAVLIPEPSSRSEATADILKSLNILSK